MAEPLDASGAEVPLDLVVLRTRGLEGTAERVRPQSGRSTRSAADPSGDDLGPSFDAIDVDVQHEIRLSRVTRTVGVERAPRTAAGDPAIELDVPDAARGFGQMVLAVDGAGIATWHFAPPPPADAPVRRGTRMRTYRVRMPSPAPSDGRPVTRGLLGTAAHAVIRVIAFPLVEGLLGRAGERFVGAWEERHRPHRLRTFGPGDYRDPHGRALDADDWRRLGEGRALLFLHGTFSRAHAGFGDLPPEAMAQLDARYRRRLLAFDHPTLSRSPEENVASLLAALPGDVDLKLDVVAHSRGGLVARTLAERQDAARLGGRALTVERIVLAGTPNAGTALADAAHLGNLVDTYTALLGFVPDVGVTDVLETIVAVAKTIAVGVAQGLDGLGAMQPGGPFLRALNAAGAGTGTTRYFALASDYEPPGRAFRDWVLDHLADALFAKAGNDLVVPTEGVYSANGSPRFPIADRHVFSDGDGVAHTGYFAAEPTARKLLEWLD
jgi:hypothetical protein